MNATQLKTKKSSLSHYFVILVILAALLVVVLIIIFKTSNKSFQIAGNLKDLLPFA